MTWTWKQHLAAAVVGAAVGSALGAVAADIENYYILSGPSFPDHPWGWLRFLGHPGYLLAGRTGPSGFVEFLRSYDVFTVAGWDGLVWAIVFPFAVLGTRCLLKLLAARNRMAR
jgi:hypothetical protein